MYLRNELKLTYHYILSTSINREFISKSSIKPTYATGTTGTEQDESKKTTNINVFNLPVWWAYIRVGLYLE